MKRIAAAIISVLILALALAGCAAKTPDEKIYALTKELDAVYLVGADGAERVYDLPDGAITAAVSGDTLWYADETVLVRLDLADLSRREYELPGDEWPRRIRAVEDEAYIALYNSVGVGKILRADEDGIERVTGKTVDDFYPFPVRAQFAVESGAVYYFSANGPLWREVAGGRTHLINRRGTVYCLSVDGGRIYICADADCRSYDAVTGGDERVELEFEVISEAELPHVVSSADIIRTAAAHDGWLYYFVTNFEYKGGNDAMRLMAKRISDGKTVEYARTDDLGFYPFEAVVTFGERGFVINDGYCQNDFRYVPYYTGK